MQGVGDDQADRLRRRSPTGHCGANDSAWQAESASFSHRLYTEAKGRPRQGGPSMMHRCHGASSSPALLQPPVRCPLGKPEALFRESPHATMPQQVRHLRGLLHVRGLDGGGKAQHERPRPVPVAHHIDDIALRPYSCKPSHTLGVDDGRGRIGGDERIQVPPGHHVEDAVAEPSTAGQ